MKSRHLIAIILLLIFSVSNCFALDYGVVIDSRDLGEDSQLIEIQPTKDQSPVFIKNVNDGFSKFTEYKTGDTVTLEKRADTDDYFITDFYRIPQLKLLFLIFAVTVILIGKKFGVMSLLGMAISFFAIIKVILPLIYTGQNPILVVIVSAIILIPVTFYLSHGINKKTNIAILSTIITAIITAFLATLFSNLSYLSGYATEEANFLDVAKHGSIDLKLLMLSGMIIGAIGILDDVTISQVGIVQELKNANPNLSQIELYKRAMNIGRDHVSSMVNTLFFVYAGASLPLLLLFLDNQMPVENIINVEFMAEEIVQTLVGSIGLILAVPITTFIATKNHN